MLFTLSCFTYWGQNLFVEVGEQIFPMGYVADSTWQVEIDVKNAKKYRYFLQNSDDSQVFESPEWRLLPAADEHLHVCDTFRYRNQSHVFRTTPFVDALCVHTAKKMPKLTSNSVMLVVDAPAVQPHECVGVLGSCDALGWWDETKIVPLNYAGAATWFVALKELPTCDFKFVVFDKKSGKIVNWELGENRHIEACTNTLILYDFRRDIAWRGAGVAIPVFSLRSDADWGVGEFYDLKQMVDWAQKTGQKIIQILPINDTTNTQTNADSYPYSAISVYALHPMYLNLKALGSITNKKIASELEKQRKALNKKSFVDYAAVNRLKMQYVSHIFAQTWSSVKKSNDYTQFFAENSHWLVPYAVFCALRDRFGSANFRQWKELAEYDAAKVENYATKHSQEVELHYFVQYNLARQLQEVRQYAHAHSVVFKGDLPIGISPNSVDAWMSPHLFNLDKQAGAPPDDFSVIGQNWGFPTYNWDEMAKDNYAWWKNRFQNMAKYFDAYRIDHILGFFRIWEMPQSAVWGLLGHFNPAMPMHVAEIENYGIYFDKERFTKPYITDAVLDELFGEQKSKVVAKFLRQTSSTTYEFTPEFDTQRKVNDYFEREVLAEKQADLLNKLLELHSEVLFIADDEYANKYHPRILLYKSHSYAALDDHQRTILARIHEDFYFRRHTEFWRLNALKKLPELLRTTNMLVCGEDLGMVPTCVPQVMNELQILSLEIQRMPKDFNTEFVSPERTPYLSVCSTGTHDTSTLRSWWHENADSTQRYFNNVLHAEGEAPVDCTPEIAQQVIAQQLSANGMLVILPLQDYLAMDADLRLADADAERINDPSNPHHFWCYRMHLTIDKLLSAKAFNDKLKNMILKSARQ